MPFPEDFLHYIWKFRQFKHQQLATTAGDSLKILAVGVHNRNAGPDFENAKIQIGETLWAGSVEIHIRSSDWQKHKHEVDPSYDNVILHVVYHHDQDQYRNDGSVLPVLELRPLIPEGLSERYQELMGNLNWIACQETIGDIDRFHLTSWLSRVLVERLEEKSKGVYQVLEEYKGSWEDSFYLFLARNFGFKVNSQPFEMLARALPLQLLARHKHNPLQVEALIFGQAGFLYDTFTEDYPLQLQREYLFLQKKYQLRPIDRYLWKFLRLRPLNFPTLRLAQFSALIMKSDHLFSRILDASTPAELRAMFTELPVNGYWKQHYRFGVTSNPFSHLMGEESVNNVLINTVALFLFCYGRNMNRSSFVNRAIGLLEWLPAENNQVIERFKAAGVKLAGADCSQALLQLKKSYCEEKRCLECGIGVKILNV